MNDELMKKAAINQVAAGMVSGFVSNRLELAFTDDEVKQIVETSTKIVNAIYGTV